MHLKFPTECKVFYGYLGQYGWVKLFSPPLQPKCNPSAQEQPVSTDKFLNPSVLIFRGEETVAVGNRFLPLEMIIIID